ncbi:MAG TPA: hypothetical protein VKF38_09715 [Anaerolineaceae bacterium]|nr:hypothetical protein [Anaerolineaceae bacterium]
MIKKMYWLLVSITLAGCGLFPFQQTAPKVQSLSAPTNLSQQSCPATAPVPTCPALPSATQTAFVTATSTLTPVPTATFPPTITFTPTQTFTPTATATTAPRVYIPQSTFPVYSQNFAHPEKGCNWMGAAGQVFDKNGKPVTNLVVSIVGTLPTSSVDMLGLTGLAKTYGSGGYEIVLSNTVVASSGTLFISIDDLAGNALTDAIPFNTIANCTKNLIIMNFKTR